MFSQISPFQPQERQSASVTTCRRSPEKLDERWTVEGGQGTVATQLSKRTLSNRKVTGMLKGQVLSLSL